MTHSKIRTLLLISLIASALFITACNVKEATVWDAAQTASQDGEAVAEDAIAGSEFNQFFPKSADGLEVIFSQEKDGFAEAVLEKDGAEVATLSISDIISNPSAADKYADSSDTLDSFPLVDVGSQGSAVLVADRFQVQVRSKADDFNRDNRVSWLAAFDLAGLSGLK